MADLNEAAKSDWQRFTKSGGFQVSITFKSPFGVIANVEGLATKHHLGIATDGQAVNSKNVHVSVSEDLLDEAGYPVRSSSGDVDMYNHKASFVDAREVLCDYSVQEIFPDEKTGMLVFVLEDRESDFEAPVLSASSTSSLINLSWTFSGSGHGGFEVYRTNLPLGRAELIASVADDILDYEDSEVQAGQFYLYQVRAFALQNKGEFSNPVISQLTVANDGAVTLNGGGVLISDVPSGGTADLVIRNQALEPVGSIISNRIAEVSFLTSNTISESYDPKAITLFEAIEAIPGYSLSDAARWEVSSIWGFLRSIGKEDDLKFWFPNIGGVLDAAAIDAANPGTYDLVFSGGPTPDANIGVTYNGTNQYALTGFTPFGNPSDFYYGVTVIERPTNDPAYYMGVVLADTNEEQIRIYETGSNTSFYAYDRIGSTWSNGQVSNNDLLGLMGTGNRNLVLTSNNDFVEDAGDEQDPLALINDQIALHGLRRSDGSVDNLADGKTANHYWLANPSPSLIMELNRRFAKMVKVLSV